MTDSARRVDIYPHLRLLLKVSRRLGFTHFNYNPGRKRFEDSSLLFFISRVVFCVGQVLSGYFVFWYTLIFFYSYVITSTASATSYESVLIQSQSYCRYVITFILIRSYLVDGHLIIPTLNEMLSVFKVIRSLTNAKMYFEERFQNLFTIKIIVATFHLFLEMVSRGSLALGGDISSPIGILLKEITFWCHLYANLVLTCFYLKMTELLSRSGARDHIHCLISLSFRIHRLKRTLNGFYTMLHASTYLGLFDDIFNMCGLFRELLRLRRHGQETNRQTEIHGLLLKFMMTFFSSFDIYLIGFVAELLTEAEILFRRKLFLLYVSMAYPSTKKLQIDMELMLTQDNIQDLSSRAFGLFVVDRRFTFNFFKDVIITNAIACLQLFVNEI